MNQIVKLLLGCTKSSAFGLQSGLILDDQMTASSQWSKSMASHARLNLTGIPYVRYGAWAPKQNHESWLMIDFIAIATIVKIKTQGRNGLTQWTKSFTLSVSNSTSFEDFKDPSNGRIKVSFGQNHRGKYCDSNSPQAIKLNNYS